MSGSCLWKLRKLKCRTLNGQLLAQYRVPTQRLYAMSFSPSGLCVVAATGQTFSHGAFSHCMHGSGCSTARGSSSAPDVIAVHADPVHLAAAQHLILADHRNVVLRLAGDHAGVAAGAGRQVDRHAPLIALVVSPLPDKSSGAPEPPTSPRSTLGFFLYSSIVTSRNSGRVLCCRCCRHVPRSCVVACSYVLPVAAIANPGANQIASRGADQIRVEPNILADAPARLRARNPSAIEIALSAWPGCIITAASILNCRARAKSIAVGQTSAPAPSRRLIIAALPHTSLVIGSGASCSQPLLAKRPSQAAELG